MRDRYHERVGGVHQMPIISDDFWDILLRYDWPGQRMQGVFGQKQL